MQGSEPTRRSDNYLAQAQAAVELSSNMERWQLVMLFILHHWHGLEVMRTGDVFIVTGGR